MSNSDLVIKHAPLSERIATLEKDIAAIEEIIRCVYNASLTLDDKKWNTKEKKVFDEDFVQYMRIIGEKYPSCLRRKVDLLKKADESYQNVDTEQKKLASQLDDLI